MQILISKIEAPHVGAALVSFDGNLAATFKDTTKLIQRLDPFAERGNRGNRFFGPLTCPGFRL